MLYSKFFLYLFLSINIYAQNLAVIVSKDSSITSIEKKELSKIFLAKTRTFQNNEKAVAVESINKEYQTKFYKEVCNKNEKQLKKYWAKMIFTGRGQPPKKIKTFEELLIFIQNNKNAISYIPFEYVNSNIKIVMEIK